MTTIHLCIATGQNAANFIPLKQLDAEEVWVLETPGMKKDHSAKSLKMAIEASMKGTRVQVRPFDDSSPQAMQAAAFALADKELDGRDVVFHVTGGTKLMVLAIHQQLANLASGSGTYRLIYADTQNQTLDWLDTPPQQMPMQDVLTLESSLLLRGYRTTNDTRPAQAQQRAAPRASVTRFMGENATTLKGFFGALNYHGREAAKGALTQEFNYLPGGQGGKLLTLAEREGLLTADKRANAVTFTNTEAAEYFSGGWVEEYVFLKFTGVFKPEQYATNAKIIHAQTKTENEIDAILVRNNRCLVVECKAKKQDDAQAAIYKLGQIVRQVGGLMARGLYVSARSVSDTDRNRAREYGIDVLAADELANVNKYLRDWAK